MKQKETSQTHGGSKIGYILVSILLLTMGTCLISLRETLDVLAKIIGCVLILFAIALFIIALAKRERGASFAFYVFFSIICIIAGVTVLLVRDKTIEVIVSLSSLFLIMDASFKLNTTAMSKRFSVPLWWIILAFSVSVIALSFFLIKFPFEEIETTSLFLGIAFVIESLSNLFSAFFISAYENRWYKEAYIEFFKTKDNPPKKIRKIIDKMELENKASEESSNENKNS